MQKKFLQILAAVLVLINFSIVTAAESWKLPSDGLKLYGAAKQNYIAEKMNALFHPAPGTKKAPLIFDVPDGWNFEKLYVDGLNVECLTNPAGDKNRVVLQIHGGGYVLPIDNGHRKFGMKLGILADASQTYFLDYRIAPENTFPAALEDALKAYKLLLTRNIPAENIIVFGDSAGGNLALALSLYLKEKNLPPMLIQCGGYELFLDEDIALAKKAVADNVKVTLTIYPEMSHDFALLLPELQDSLDSFKEIQDFVNSL